LRCIFVTITLCLTMLVTSAIGAGPASATTPTVTTANQIAMKVFALLNYERYLHHLAPLHMDARLNYGAQKHNWMMAKYNTMSHQLPGEASLGARIDAQGYYWRACGENVAWNSDWTLAGAYYLEQLMYNEVAPYNGHRLNILSTTTRDIGVNVYMDAAHHKMWLSEDFGLHM